MYVPVCLSVVHTCNFSQHYNCYTISNLPISGARKSHPISTFPFLYLQSMYVFCSLLTRHISATSVTVPVRRLTGSTPTKANWCVHFGRYSSYVYFVPTQVPFTIFLLCFGSNSHSTALQTDLTHWHTQTSLRRPGSLGPLTLRLLMSHTHIYIYIYIYIWSAYS